MAEKVVVLVADRDDPKHGEVTVLADPRKAERLVETLLEAGFDKERIRIFNGAEMDIQVTQRPVVALVGEPAAESDSDTGEEMTSAEELEESVPQAEGEPETEEEGEPEPATAYVQNGVRFSSLFRGA